MSGGADPDWMSGGHGSDTITGGDDGGAGDTLFYNAEVRTAGVTVTLDGNRNDGDQRGDSGHEDSGAGGGPDFDLVETTEHVEGTALADSVTGDGGDNFIDTGDGDDAVAGEGGDDTLSGGDGTDTLQGGGGDDWLIGGDGNDSFDGGTGSADGVDYSGHLAGVQVSLNNVADDGVPGNSTDGNTGTGSADNVQKTVERVLGTEDDDTISALGGDAIGNYMDGAGGTDSLTGGGGDDTIAGGGGSDDLDGGEGDDIFDEGSAANGSDSVNGGSGAEDGGGDRVNYSLRSTTIAASIDTAAANDGADANSDGDAADFADERDTLGTDIERVATGSGADRIIGGAGANRLEGNGGADNIVGGGDADSILGGAGDDTVTGSAGADTLDGGPGDDVFAQGATADGADTLGGGETAETLGDLVDYSRRTTAVAVTVGGGADDGEDANANGVAGDAGDEKDAVASDVERVAGGTGADTLTGDDQHHALAGNAGDDVLQGGAGDDSLDGGSGSDRLSYAAAGAGVIVTLASTSPQNTGGAGTDTLAGLENLTGSVFGDSLTGADTVNNIHGGDGNDAIDGRLGADTLAAGTGDDSVNAADGVSDRAVDCGGDVDTATVDPMPLDRVVTACETVLGRAPGPGTGGPGPGTGTGTGTGGEPQPPTGFTGGKANIVLARFATVKPNGTVVFRLANKNPFRVAGRLSLQTAKAFAGAVKKRKLKLGARRFAAPKQTTVRIRVKLTRAGRRLVARTGRLRVVVTVSLKGATGRRLTVRRPAVLNAPKKRPRGQRASLHFLK